MFKKFLKVFMVLSLFGLFIGLTSCDKTTGDNSGSENENVVTDPNIKNIYLDSDKIDNDSFSLTLKSKYCSSYSTNYSLSIYFDLVNKEYSTKKFTIKNTTLTKVSTNATYTVNYNNSVSVEAELTSSLSFSATIPSSIDTDEYKLYFEIESLKVTLYLYETPDSLRVDRKITYYINDYLNNTEVHTDTVKDKRTVSTVYNYESADNQSYCNTWYTDSTFKTLFSTSTPVTEDISLYGRPVSNIKWTSLSSDVYAFVNGINHVPSNGILVIPSKYMNKELCIGLYAIKDINVSKIYIPKTVHTIYSGNFTGIGNATVYYEGTEAEWKALFYMQSDVYTKNIVYNTKYTG